MADRIKGITIEIDGDTTKLQSALKGVNSEIKSTQSNLKDIDKLLKLDPGNTELLQQKYKNLGSEIDSTKSKLDTLKEAQSQMESAGLGGTEEYDALQREITETEQKLKGLEDEYKEFGSVQAQQVAAAGEKMKDLGDKVSSAGEKLLPVTAAITAVGAASYSAASDFESSFAQLSTIADTNEVTADQLKQQIIDVSNQYGVSASEIAESTYSAISAGRSTGEAVDFVATATQAAKAGFTDSGTAIDTLTTIMNAYGDSAGTAQEISDRLLTTQNMGKTTFAELGTSIGKVIPTAAMYGVNLDNLASAYVATTKNGIATAESTTYINGMLNELGKSGSTASKILEEETGKSFKELMDGGASLSDVLQIVSDHADASGLSIADCFGSQEAAKAAATIVQHTEDFDSALQQMGNSAGTTATAFETMDSTSESSIEKMKVAVQNAGITIGESLAPFVTQAANAIAEMAKAFTNLPGPVQKTIIAIAAIVAAIGPVLIIVGKVMSGVGSIMTMAPKIISGIGTLKGVISGLGGGLSSLWSVLMANPIVLVIAAVVALVAIFVYLWNNCEGFRDFWIGLWENIKSVVSTAIDAIKGFFSGIIDFVSNNWQGLLLLLVNPFAGAFKLLYDNCEGFREFVNTFLENVKALISAAWEAITTGIQTFLTNAQTVITTVWTAITTFFTTVLETIKTIFTTAWNAITTTITTVLNTIKTTVTTIWNGIKTVVTTVMNAIKTAISTAWNAVKSTVTTVINGIKSVISSGMNAAKSTIESVLGAIKSKFQSIWDGVKSIVSGAIEKIKGLMNFEWHLPHLSLPHFSISGSFSLNPPSVPHFSVDWYKKAMENGMILNSPTIFGAAGGQLLGAGEAGAEAVVGVDSLKDMIQSAVTAVSGGDITIPVYIGNRKIEDLVVSATQRANYRSGGR